MTQDRLDRKEKPPTRENRPETVQLPVLPVNLATGKLGRPGTPQTELGGPGSPRSCSRPHRNPALRFPRRLRASREDNAPRKRTSWPAKASCEGPRYGELRTPGAIGLKTDEPSE